MDRRIVPTLMVAAVVSLALTLLFGGFIAYQWLLAFEAIAASLVLFVFWVRYYHRDRRKSRWPPLLPSAFIAGAGGAKSLYVATDKGTPWLVIVVLLAAVVWFAISSWQIFRAARRVPG